MTYRYIVCLQNNIWKNPADWCHLASFFIMNNIRNLSDSLGLWRNNQTALYCGHLNPERDHDCALTNVVKWCDDHLFAVSCISIPVQCFFCGCFLWAGWCEPEPAAGRLCSKSLRVHSFTTPFLIYTLECFQSNNLRFQKLANHRIASSLMAEEMCLISYVKLKAFLQRHIN